MLHLPESFWTRMSSCSRAFVSVERARVRGIILLACVVLTGTAAPAAQSQDAVARGDELLRAGRVFAAESVYYWAVTSRPRDPAARLALGRYLAARGAQRTAATLMEEARFFGGDPAVVAAQLAPLYERMGEYRLLATLPRSPLSVAEQARAEWLRDNRPARRGPAQVTLPLLPHDASSLGAFSIRIGRDSILARIDPSARGVTLDSEWLRRRDARRFGRDGDGAPVPVGVVAELRAGELTLTNVPVAFAALGGAEHAVVGLEWLARLAPTFDEGNSAITLRPGGKVTGSRSGRGYPTLLMPDGIRLVTSHGVVQLADPAGRGLLRGRRWTIAPDQIILE
jgi:hypothetical protein